MVTVRQRQFLKLTKQLDEEIEKSIELFIKQRPFLLDHTIDPPEILTRTDNEIEEKITNDFAIEELIKRIQESAKMS